MATAANVRVGVGGAVYYDVTGLAGNLPTDATTAIHADFTAGDVGYISEDGISQTIGSSQTKLKAWGGDVVRTVTTEHSLQYSFTMIELNDKVAKLYTGDATATATAFKIKNGDNHRSAWVIAVNDEGYVIRVVIPDGEIVAVGDMNLKTAELLGFPVTIEAYPDTNGNKAYIYTDSDGVA